MSGKALMTHYQEGSLISRELHDMLYESAAQSAFDRALPEDFDLLADRNDKPYGRDGLLHKGNWEEPAGGKSTRARIMRPMSSLSAALTRARRKFSRASRSVRKLHSVIGSPSLSNSVTWNGNFLMLIPS